jgi:apolipoprotein N-acyltransferase
MSPIMTRPRARWLVLALALGLLHALSFAPWGNWWTQVLVLAAYAFLALTMIRHGQRPRQVALAGMLFGFGWFLAGVGWLFVSMHTYGMMPAPLALLALVLFALYLSLFPAAAIATSAALRFRRRGPDKLPENPPHAGPDAPVAWAAFALPFAATLTLAELLRGWLFTGFPWLAVGYAQMDGPLAGYAGIAGSYGVGFAACLVAGLVAALPVAIQSGARPVPSALVTLVPAAALLVAGHICSNIVWSDPVGKPLKVRLLQGNVPQQMKFDPVVARQTMQRYLELVAAEPSDLIVLPETAWTVPWESTPRDIADRLEQFVVSSGSAVAIGLPLTTPRRHRSDPSAAARSRREQPISLTNSVLLFDRAVFESDRSPASPMRYDKRHLVPFGEFVPWGFRWFVDLMTIPLGDFGRGSADQPPFAVAGQRIAFNICYEDAFGEELLPALAGPDGATILANISNIAWFGDSHALPQHLQIARMRTLETARPMIRATNTGVTAAIDFDGTVLASLPPYQLGALAVTIQGRSGMTPYARTGNWPIAALSLLLLAAAVLPAATARVRHVKPAKIPR